MANSSKNRYRTKTSGARIAALVVFVLVVIAATVGYFTLFPSSKPNMAEKKEKIQVSTLPQQSAPKTIQPQETYSEPVQVIAPQQKKQNTIHQVETVAEQEKKPSVAVPTPRLAIIIDDMGSNVQEARSLAAIKVPLTFAIIPGLRHDKEVAVFASSNKFETIIHIPMQSKGWPQRRLEANGLLVSMDSVELQERVTEFVRQFPKAVGVNNHMGSEFTEQEAKMTAVLQVLKDNNLFFIDSVTSPESCGIKISKSLAIKSARRNVFLDNVQERNYILGQLNQAVKLARKNGSAIAICHPHQATIATLAAALPGLVGEGIELVSASKLVR